MVIDSNINLIIRYLESDTIDFDRDSLRAWYYRDHSLPSDLILAGDLYDSGEFTKMNAVLNDIPNRFVLSSIQLQDIRRVKYCYGILAARTNFGLTSTDIDSLKLFSEGAASCAALARSILSVNFDSIYCPRYYIPGELMPRSSVKESGYEAQKDMIKIYPNPAVDEITVECFKTLPEMKLNISNINGQLLDTYYLNNGTNYIHFSDKYRDGIYIYILFQ